jgi:hypothetical protein
MLTFVDRWLVMVHSSAVAMKGGVERGLREGITRVPLVGRFTAHGAEREQRA